MALAVRTGSDASKDAKIPWYSSLQFQLMAVTTGLVLVIMVIFGFGTGTAIRGVFDDQIKKGGAALISSVSILARSYFEDLEGLTEPGDAEKLQKRCEADLQRLLMTGPGEGVAGAFDVLNIFFVSTENVDPYFQRKYGTVRAVGEGAYDLTVLGGSNRYWVRLLERYVPTEISVSEGTMLVGKSRETLRARIFEQPVYNDKHKQICTVYLILSAQRIEEEQWRLVLRMLLAFLISMVIGIATSFTVARRITNPITSLVKDFQIVSKGDLEHRSFTRETNEVGYLARSFNEMTARLRIAHQVELEHRTREHEMKVAIEIQESLLPKSIPRIPGYDIAAYYRPSREVGGDYYDFIEMGGKNLGVVVADVSGKGIPASMVMTMTRSVMRYAALRNPSPADTLREVNRVISGDLREGTFVTAFFVVLHTEKRELVVASAGHNPLLILKAGTGECIPVKPKGIALGLDKGNIFNGVICEETLRLSPGDKVFMYTDGIIEARNSEAEQFGKGRLAEILRNSQQYDSQTTIKMIVDAVSYHAGEAAQYDDITAALISVK